MLSASVDLSAMVAPDCHGVKSVLVPNIEKGRSSRAGVFGITGAYVSGSEMDDDVLLPVVVDSTGRVLHDAKFIGRIEPYEIPRLLVSAERAHAIFAAWQADDAGVVPEIHASQSFAFGM